MFIRVIETDYNDELIINTNNISYIHQASNTVLVNGVDGTGKSLVHLESESMKKILDNIKIV